jgi:hypothetical protein
MNFLDHVRQPVRLGKKCRPWWDAILMAPSRPARGKDDRKSRLCVDGPVCEVTPIPTTKIDVSEQDIDHLLSKDDLGLLSTGGGQDRKPSLIQDLGC